MTALRSSITAHRTLLALVAASLAASACAKHDTAASDSSKVPPMSADAPPAAATTPKAPGKPDAEMQAVLDELAALHGKPIESLTAAEARKQPTPTDAVMKLLAKQGKPATPPPGATMTTRKVPGAAGQLSANIYTPDGAGPFPVIVYYHGGGWVIANKDVYDGGARALAIGAKAVVVSADYRQGPEAKFPAAHDDAVAVYEWVCKNAASLKGDPKKIALAGESAGGGHRDRGARQVHAQTTGDRVGVPHRDRGYDIGGICRERECEATQPRDDELVLRQLSPLPG